MRTSSLIPISPARASRGSDLTTDEERGRALAEGFRASRSLGAGPIKDMHELVHVTMGIDVISMKASEAEHGLSMCDPVIGRVVVAVATTPHPMRQRSSIAHELGHVQAGDLESGEELVPGRRSAAEIRADAFARHLLLPLDAVHLRFAAARERTVPSLAHLSELVQTFGVSPQIAAIQLRRGDVIDDETCSRWGKRSTVSLATMFGWASQYRALAADSLAPRAPQSLMARAVAGYQRGVLGIRELATWYGQDAAVLGAELGEPQHDVDDDEWDDDAPLFPRRGEEPVR